MEASNYRLEILNMLSFSTSAPHKLLGQIKSKIAEGHITTWACDSDGDFTHSPPQWIRKAWLRPTVVEGKALQFGIIFPNGAQAGREIYAVYHGRFTEMMLAHFDSDFSQVTASALLASSIDRAA